MYFLEYIFIHFLSFGVFFSIYLLTHIFQKLDGRPYISESYNLPLENLLNFMKDTAEKNIFNEKCPHKIREILW